MFLITQSPLRCDDALAISVVGEVLVVNGVALDLGALAPGESLARDAVGSDWIASDIVRRENGEITLTLIVPHGAEAAEAARFPRPIVVTGDGPVTLG